MGRDRTGIEFWFAFPWWQRVLNILSCKYCPFLFYFETCELCLFTSLLIKWFVGFAVQALGSLSMSWSYIINRWQIFLLLCQPCLYCSNCFFSYADFEFHETLFVSSYYCFLSYRSLIQKVTFLPLHISCNFPLSMFRISSLILKPFLHSEWTFMEWRRNNLVVALYTGIYQSSEVWNVCC